jgi:hypothetical protein
MVERARTKSTPGTEFLKKMAEESNSRFVSAEESAVAPQTFNFRRQLLPQPVAGFEFAKQAGRLDHVRTFSGRSPWLGGRCAAANDRWNARKIKVTETRREWAWRAMYTHDSFYIWHRN